MKFRIITDRIMKNGWEVQYKIKCLPFWLYLKPLRTRKTYYTVEEALKVLDILNGGNK